MQKLQADSAAVRVRGRDNTVEFILDDTSPAPAVQQALREYLFDAAPRYKDLSVYVSLGRYAIEPEVARSLLEAFADTGIEVREVLIAPESLETSLTDALGATVRVGTPNGRGRQQQAEKPANGDEVLLVRHTCRTGTTIQYPGNIVVQGNVNPGAELVAGGDVVVIGALRGVAHAGAFGNLQSRIIAFSLQPTQLRIAGVIAIGSKPQARTQHSSAPEVAYLDDGAIVIEPYVGSTAGAFNGDAN